MVVVAVVIVLAQQSGHWPDAPQGVVGEIVQSAVVLLPMVPRRLRSALAWLRRLWAGAAGKGRAVDDLTAILRESAMDRVGGGPSEVADSGPVTAGEPAEDVGVDDVPAGDVADFGGEDGNPILLGMLVDPTMWPSWPPTPDNDDSAVPGRSDGGDGRTADGDGPVAPDHGDGRASPRADNDDAAKPTAM